PNYSAPQPNYGAHGHQEGLSYEGMAQPAYGSGYLQPTADCYGGACGDDLMAACSPRWFGGVYGLYMTRDDSNHLCFSYDTDNWNYQPLTSRTVDWDWRGGVEARIGHMFGCNWGLEAVYWGLF